MIRKVHLIVKSHKQRNAGTKSDPVLIVGRQTSDLIHETFHSPEGLIEGKAAHFTVDVSGLNLEQDYQYTRLGIRGADMWLPEYIFAWIERDPQYPNEPTIMPLALETFSATPLSTDEFEGRLSIPVTPAWLGGYYTRIQRLLVVVKTSAKHNAGTRSEVRLTVRKADGSVMGIAINEHGETETGNVHISAPYLNDNIFPGSLRNLTLSIHGEDAWRPSEVYVFGFSDEYDQQKFLVPLVYIPDWNAAGLPQMSTDKHEGQAEVTLYQVFQ